MLVRIINKIQNVKKKQDEDIEDMKKKTWDEKMQSW